MKKILSIVLAIALCVTMTYGYSHETKASEVHVVKAYSDLSNTGVITDTGDLYFWGDEPVGDGTRDNTYKPKKIMSNIKEFVDSSTKCVLTNNNELYGWGYNTSGRLGNGKDSGIEETPYKILDNVNKADIVSSMGSALTYDNSMYTWGSNLYGNIGNGTYDDQLTPYKVAISDVVDMKSNGTAMALTRSGSLYGWGWNLYGTVGTNNSDRYVKSPELIMSNVKKFGCDNTYVITNSNELYCWGYNTYGEVGDGTTTHKWKPVKILDNVENYGGAMTSYAVLRNGDMYCWGYNDYGAVGNGTTALQKTPVKVLSNVKEAYHSGSRFAAAITNDGSLYMWGDGCNCGVGSLDKQLTPQKILSNVSKFGSSGESSYAILNNGDLYCWGRDLHGGIGDGYGNEVKEHQLTPVKILSGVKDAHISYTSYAITNSGEFYCWGSNDRGQVGDGTRIDRWTPVKINFEGGSEDNNNSNDNNNNTNNDELLNKTVIGWYRDGSREKVLSDKELYKDEYFSNSATVGQGDLAKLSMLASSSAYNKTYAESLMNQCGFKYKYFNSKITAKSNDKVSYIVGTKKVKGTNIVAVWVKGTSANYEWVSNFNLGKKKTHSGFSKAESGMNKSITSYLNKQGIKSNIKFWVTGHSRGAAVANLYAKRLTNKFSKYNVFAYTFATPRVSKSAKKGGYENIRNYLNPGDFVTEVAPKKWGYKRYGTDITFNEKNRSIMAKSFKSLTNKKYGGFNSKGKNKLVNAFVNYGGKNVKSYYKKKTYHYKINKKKKKMKASPADYCQKGLAYFLHADKKVQKKGMNYIKIISTQNSKAAVVTAKMIIDGGITYQFKDAHTQAGYLCWLKLLYN